MGTFLTLSFFVMCYVIVKIMEAAQLRRDTKRIAERRREIEENPKYAASLERAAKRSKK